MRKRILFILLGVVAFFTVLGAGAVGGAGLTYFILQGRPARAALAIQPVRASQEGGVLVAAVEPDSPAEAAGLSRGDIITEVGGEAVDTPHELLAALEGAPEGEDIELTVFHGDEQRALSLSPEGAGDSGLGLQTCAVFFSGRGRPVVPGDLWLRGVGPGALVLEVVPGGPAAEAGLKAGDRITAIDGEALGAEADLAGKVQARQPGEEITLTVQRPGEAEDLEVQVTLAENPDEPSQAYLGISYQPVPDISSGDGQPWVPLPDWPGFEGKILPFLPHGGVPPFEFLVPQLPAEVESAAVIGEVAAGSPAEAARLKKGDFITALNGEPVADAGSLAEAVRALRPGDEVNLTVYRPPSEEDAAGGGDAAAEPLSIDVILGENPDQEGEAYLGLTVQGFIRIEKEEQPGPGLFFGPPQKDEPGTNTELES
jgi:S1-C subfamily serine protease